MIAARERRERKVRHVIGVARANGGLMTPYLVSKRIGAYGRRLMVSLVETGLFVSEGRNWRLVRNGK